LQRDICSGVAGNQVFGERLPRLLTSEFVIFFLVDIRRIVIDDFVFFLVDVRADRDGLLRLRLLPGGRSRDCTANIFLHRLWSATHYVD